MCNIKLLYICLEFWVLQRGTNTRIGPTSSIGCKVVLCPLPPVFGCIRGGQVGSGVGPQGSRWSSPTKSPQVQLLSLPTVAQYLWTTQCDVNTLSQSTRLPIKLLQNAKHSNIGHLTSLYWLPGFAMEEGLL